VGRLAKPFVPPKEWELGRMSVHTSPRTRLPLMPFAALQSLMSTLVVDLLGYLRPPWPCCFQPTFAGFPEVPAPASKRAGSSSLELSTDFRVRGRSGSAFTLPKKSKAPPVEFLPPSRHQHRGFIIISELPTSRFTSALSVPPALDGLLPTEPLGLISSRSHVRGSPDKGFPCCQADSPHR